MENKTIGLLIRKPLLVFCIVEINEELRPELRADPDP